MGTRAAPVQLCECWARDGLQAWRQPTDLVRRTELLNRCLTAGFAEVEIGAVVPTAVSPQFADLSQLMAGLSRPDHVRTRVLTPNLKGVQRLAAIPEAHPVVTTVGAPISASDTHNRANLRKSTAAQLAEVEQICDVAHDEGWTVVVAIAMAFGCPREGFVDPDMVLNLVERLADVGVDVIEIADSTGLADPRSTARLFTEAAERCSVPLAAHFHDTRGRGLANTLAAITSGAALVDSCLGGIGGEPPTVDTGHVGEAGNVVTEDLVSMLDQMGIDCGMSTADVIGLGEELQQILGSRLRSTVLQSGPGMEVDMSFRAARDGSPR